MAGLNFSNEDEANAFRDAIIHKIDLRRARVEGEPLAALRHGLISNCETLGRNMGNNDAKDCV